MGRYDRIARIDPPSRDDAYDGWLSLRDLDGREREPELGRRALLRFLALRPVRRLLARGLEAPGAGSLEQQLEAVRHRLAELPAEDSDRRRLAAYLEEIGGRSASGMVRATLDVGASAEAAGHVYAAEEFYRTAIELARSEGLELEHLTALRWLARLLRERGEWSDARDLLSDAAEQAGRIGALEEWARAREAMAAVALRQGEVDEARSILDDMERSDGSSDDSPVRAIAATGRCALELASGRAEAALEAGWTAVRRLPPQDEARSRVLLNMAAAFRRLGLGAAAASCYEIVIRWAAWPEHRIEARLEHALVAAEAVDATGFAERRNVVLDSLDQADRPLKAMVHLGLGRGALLVGATDHARAHLREAITTSRDLDATVLLERAEELLTLLEQEQPATTAPPDGGDEEARRVASDIASEIQGLARANAEATH